MSDIRVITGGEVRDISEAQREFTARVVNYNKVDWYGTVWMPGVFNEGLREKLPKCVWGHDRKDVIGRAIDFADHDDGLDLRIKLSEFDAVPRAKQAFVQLRDRDIDEFSFAFDRKEWDNVDDDNQPGVVERMKRAVMVEASPVLEGAVPGTHLVGEVRDLSKMTMGEVVREVIRVIDLRSQPEPEPVGDEAVDVKEDEDDHLVQEEDMPAADVQPEPDQRCIGERSADVTDEREDVLDKEIDAALAAIRRG